MDVAEAFLMSARLVNQGPATLIAQEAQWSEFFPLLQVQQSHWSNDVRIWKKHAFIARADDSSLLHFRNKIWIRTVYWKMSSQIGVASCQLIQLQVLKWCGGRGRDAVSSRHLVWISYTVSTSLGTVYALLPQANGMSAPCCGGKMQLENKGETKDGIHFQYVSMIANVFAGLASRTAAWESSEGTFQVGNFRWRRWDDWVDQKNKNIYISTYIERYQRCKQ